MTENGFRRKNDKVERKNIREENLRLSDYNFFFRVDDNQILAYNSCTTALVELSKDEFHNLKNCLHISNDCESANPELKSLRDNLVDLGLLVPQKKDELGNIKLFHNSLKENQRHLGLTIIPTLDCNFRCSYCFSYNRKERMGEDVQKALLRFADNLLDKTNSLTVSWFGGEPTLCLDTVEFLMRGFSNLCEKHNVPFKESSIITNGFLLDVKKAKLLRQLGITRVQITLDGDRDTHNQRRPLRGGKGTFDKILENINQIHDILEIYIRINIDRSNVDSAVRTLDTLVARNLQGKVGVYLGHVKPFTEACGDISTSCFSNQEYSTLSLDFTKQAIGRGFNSFPYPKLQLDGVCGVDKPFSYVVSPNGLLFKCWAEASVGEEWSVGSILTENLSAQQERNLMKYMGWDPFANDQCVTCRFLPICMGGCPHQTIRHKISEDCSQWRYNLLETLAMRYKLGDRVKINSEWV